MIKKERYYQLMKKISLIKSKKYVAYVKKRFKYHKVRDHCHYTGKNRWAVHDICNLRYKKPKEITAIFHNGSTHDYHFVMKELAKEAESQFESLGENTEKYLVQIKKELHNGKTNTYTLKFIDTFRFMSISLLKLFNNLSEICSKKCRNKNCKSEWDFKRLVNKLSYNYRECRKNS